MDTFKIFSPLMFIDIFFHYVILIYIFDVFSLLTLNGSILIFRTILTLEVVAVYFHYVNLNTFDGLFHHKLLSFDILKAILNSKDYILIFSGFFYLEGVSICFTSIN